MLKSSTVLMALIINILIICLWHFLSFNISRFISQSLVDYKKLPYRAYKSENRGKFYRDNFDIDAWYGVLPIKYNRENININVITESDIPTLTEYINLTCRSELCSIINLFYFLFAIAVNLPAIGFIVGVLVVLGNMPFIFANRYARFLLLNELVKKRRLVQINQYIEEHNTDKYDFRNFE
ncbi:MAG: hypothetical protein II440_05670 [Clostridia bacterium]|nr:hypothetical protein [Clostridia bacterium]